MLIFTKRLSPDSNLPLDRQTIIPLFILSLTAQERTRSRYRFETSEGQPLLFQLPRGTVLEDGDFLQSETAEVIKITAKPEPVYTVTAKEPLDLLRTAYHLGNRHIPLEITFDYLRLSPDPVLKKLLEHLGVEVIEEIVSFQPEIGAYGH